MTWTLLLYIIPAVLFGIIAATIIIYHVRDEFLNYHTGELDPADSAFVYIMGIIGGGMAGAGWPIVLPLVGVGFLIRWLLRLHDRVETWTEEANRMSPERRAAYEAAWREVDPL